MTEFEIKRLTKRVADLEHQTKSIELFKVAVLEINENLIDIKQRLIQLEISNQ